MIEDGSWARPRMLFQKHRAKTMMIIGMLALTVAGFYFASTIGTSNINVARKSVFETNTQLNRLAGTWGESSLAVDPTDPRNVIINALGYTSAPIYSSNGGLNWTLSSGLVGACLVDPWATYDSRGNAYVSMWKGGAPPNNCSLGNYTEYAFLGKSTDHGASFSRLGPFISPQTTWILPDGTTSAENITCTNWFGTSFDYDKIVADQNPTSPFRDNVYLIGGVTVYDPLFGGCEGELGFIRSADGGATYDIHNIIQRLGGRASGIPASGFIENIVTSPNGTILFPWSEGGAFGLAFSKDGGSTWGYRTITFGVGCCGQVRIAVQSDKVLYVVFEEASQNGGTYSQHVFLTKSTDGGAAWSSPTRLDDALQNDSVDHTLPVIDVASDGHVFVAWRDFRNTATRLSSTSKSTDIYAYSSLVPGNIRISSSTGQCCDYPGNDYFNSAATNSTDLVSYSIDEDFDSTSFTHQSPDENFVTLVSYTQQSVTPLSIISRYWTWVVAGTAIGLFLTIMVERRHRRNVERDGETKKTGQPGAASLLSSP